MPGVKNMMHVTSLVSMYNQIKTDVLQAIQ
jgi:hypothetical protein